MSFFSIEFSLIFLAFLLIYWNIKNLTLKNTLLLLFNHLIIFLLGGPWVTLMIFCYTIFIYFCALFIQKTKARFFFIACITLAVLNLCFFKYHDDLKNFLEQILSLLGFSFLHQTQILLPLGISFYTFTSITYLRAVYEQRFKQINPNLENFANLATYLSFFPTFISGPIMRSNFFFTQLKKSRIWNPGHVNLIFMLLLFGIIKKVLIATSIEQFSSPILQSPSGYNIIELLLAIYGYGIQLYCDFSGYINLVGAFALMIGFTLPPNFKAPYIARNLKDFWNRWHISLSTFIRDFIYIPLGGNKRGFLLTQIFVLIAFGASGIWHGNTLNFLLWGLLHGFGIVFLNVLKRYNIHFKNVPLLPKLATFHYVTFCWIFFYYADFASSLGFLQAFDPQIPIHKRDALLLFAAFVLFVLYQFMEDFLEFCTKFLEKIPHFIKPILLGMILILVFFLMPDGVPNFIYASF
ncbi:MBOAT family O-acyltransferase [Helicobacter mustelae]|uniref:Putative Alginate O-acetyltransferase AlgI n=1 Tax=Helicobacter mustelae (strain ATCC 43772 / CCUG 25715 / CIP 103759 / LMG 18044 / NCTC 12198 / R85-136P) TaxID=679897 RepID=D3UGN6_HELM1|nr:MBOAT family O-acyltransferase [Helicobacter mustelae]CBG39657.1 putative Alginate O-acetyltransferase; AlgI [Helicobacter mustelae 12198]SQH71167.1 alginate O-acetyltransferase AlgI [Helicobacter mustelae]